MKKASLPYIDNAKAVLLTVAINLGVVFLFHRSGITFRGVLVDSLICAVILVVVDLWIVYVHLLKLRARGLMPTQVPVSALMQKLPQNPFALGVIYAVIFGAVVVGVNAAILWVFGKQSMTFASWLVYKIVYTTYLSVKVTEYCIFRYVQPDWANAGPAGAEAKPDLKPVKDPLPKIGVFAAMYGGVTGNIATNMIFGLITGGVTIASDGSVISSPTTVAGVPIGGMIFGLILGTLVTNGVVKDINAAILASGAAIPEDSPSDKRFSWMPKGKGMLMVLVCVCTMVFSAFALWFAMTLFGISVMNAYQYAIFISAYATIISKPLSYVLVRRCTQPDYALYEQKRMSR